MTDKPPVFKDTNEYTAFTLQHKIFGQAAIKLKKALDKSSKRLNAQLKRS